MVTIPSPRGHGLLLGSAPTWLPPHIFIDLQNSPKSEWLPLHCLSPQVLRGHCEQREILFSHTKKVSLVFFFFLPSLNSKGSTGHFIFCSYIIYHIIYHIAQNINLAIKNVHDKYISWTQSVRTKEHSEWNCIPNDCEGIHVSRWIHREIKRAPTTCWRL